MPQIPHDRSLESSLALLREGSTFISTRCERYRSDIFQTRLLLQTTFCMSGEQAARLFYDNDRFTRVNAAPKMLQKTLFGEGGVQGLDGEAHRVRKRMFMSLMTERQIAALAEDAERLWQAGIIRWQAKRQIVLLDEVRMIHCRAVCHWAGVPLDEASAGQRCADLTALIDGAGGVGRRHWQARRARSRAETWIIELIEQVRANHISVDEDSALFAISWHRDEHGNLLTPRIAAVEVLNVLRPCVAVARFVIFAALALHERPEWRQRLQTDEALLEPFIQEVRRYYAFFPFVAARVRRTFDWRGYHFPKGTRVLLDLYGTNRDSRSWQNPHEFQPERFQQNTANAFNFIPQGGGDHDTNHRCPGEWFTLALMKVAVGILTRAMRYEVPQQNLRVDWTRMPIVPESRFVINEVKPATAGSSIYGNF